MGQSKKLTQLTNIRTLAIMMVVLGHSIILYSSEWDLYTTTVSAPFLNSLKKLLDVVQMPLFFSLSGYLFVFTHRMKHGIFRLLKSKTLRLLVPYVGIGVGFLLPVRLAVGFPSYQNMGIGAFARNLLTSSDVGHLWFLPALFVMFLLSELLLCVFERLPLIGKWADFLLCVTALGLYLEGYRISLGYLPLLSAYKYLLWFALGYLINTRQTLLRGIYGFSVLKWGLLTLNAALLWFIFTGKVESVLASLIVVALCIVNAYGAIPEKSCALVEKVDRNSFGIYLFHSPMIYITFATIPDAHPVIVVFLNLVVFGGMAYGLTALIRRTKMKVLIGE